MYNQVVNMIQNNNLHRISVLKINKHILLLLVIIKIKLIKLFSAIIDLNYLEDKLLYLVLSKIIVIKIYHLKLNNLCDLFVNNL
jgi:hypothetical protein